MTGSRTASEKQLRRMNTCAGPCALHRQRERESERFTDLDFVDNTDIFEEPVEVLVSSLDVLSKLSEILGLRVSWEK